MYVYPASAALLAYLGNSKVDIELMLEDLPSKCDNYVPNLTAFSFKHNIP